MGVFTSGNMSIVGGIVDITETKQSEGVIFIPPRSSVNIPETMLAVRRGVFTLKVRAIDKANPFTVGGPRTYSNCIPVTINVFAKGAANPVATATTYSGMTPSLNGEALKTLEIDAGQPNQTASYSRSEWSIQLLNDTDQVAQIDWYITFIRDTSLISEGAVPLSVLNTSLGIALNALTPTGRLNGDKLTLHLSPEIEEYSGPLPPLEVAIDLPSGISVSGGELMSPKAEIVPGSELLAAVETEWARRDQALRGGGGGQAAGVLQSLIKDNNDWRDDWRAKVDPADVTLKASLLISDIAVTLRAAWIGRWSLGDIAVGTATLYIAFKNHQAFSPETFGKGYGLVLAPTDAQGALLSIGDAFGLVPDLAEKISSALTDHIPKIHLYFAEILARLVGDQYTRRFISCRIDGDRLLVRYCDDPTDKNAFPTPVGDPPRTDPPASNGGRGGRWGHMGGAVGPMDETLAQGDAVEPPPFGPPESFTLGSAEGLRRLDKIETIVVVMMENRSFDHMLGRLGRKWPDRGYICYPDGASNSIPGQPPYKMVPARDIQLGATYLALSVSPYHSTEHVKRQIDDGAMDGFVRDIMEKRDPADRVPQLPMTYYDEADLPLFYAFADHYAVCDRWFAAHPGGTYPNRWATLSGVMPSIENFDFDDPRMGSIETPTIFDHLTGGENPVEWVYYETNIGMIRMYKNYRIDGKRVLPIGSKKDGTGFFAQAAAGGLPPVVFIEPGITGIPPLAQASDDHAPANLIRGQQFLYDVVDALRKSPQWASTMLVVTYDEHGGFFDHMPPPGTPLGDPDWSQGGFPKLHPLGETYLGPRVPTFVISPYAEPGSVCHTIFDHTSIIKTILTRHRGKFRRNIFDLFGERVPKMAHLGEALQRDEPFLDQDLPQPQARSTGNYGDLPMPRPTLASLAAHDDGGDDDVPFGLSLARAFLPK